MRINYYKNKFIYFKNNNNNLTLKNIYHEYSKNILVFEKYIKR